MVRKRETHMKLLGAAARAASIIPDSDGRASISAGHGYIGKALIWCISNLHLKHELYHEYIR